SDLASDERLTADWRLVIEQDAVARVEAVRLAIIDRDPVAVELRDAVRRSWVERRLLGLRDLLHQAVELRSRRLIEARLVFQTEDADGFEQSQRSERVAVGRVLRLLERHCDVRLRGKVVQLVRLHLLHHVQQARRIRHVAVMQDQLAIAGVRILIQIVDAIGVEQGRPALDPVDLIALADEEFREIGAVLAGDAGDEGFFLSVLLQDLDLYFRGRTRFWRDSRALPAVEVTLGLRSLRSSASCWHCFAAIANSSRTVAVWAPRPRSARSASASTSVTKRITRRSGALRPSTNAAVSASAICRYD